VSGCVGVSGRVSVAHLGIACLAVCNYGDGKRFDVAELHRLQLVPSETNA
jgi:hypothetical protein